MCAYVCVLYDLSFSERRISHFKKSLRCFRTSWSQGPWRAWLNPARAAALGRQDQDHDHNHDHVLLAPAAALPPAPVRLRSKCQDRGTPLEKQKLLDRAHDLQPSATRPTRTRSRFQLRALFLQGPPLNPELGAVWSHDGPILMLHKLSI